MVAFSVVKLGDGAVLFVGLGRSLGDDGITVVAGFISLGNDSVDSRLTKSSSKFISSKILVATVTTAWVVAKTDSRQALNINSY